MTAANDFHGFALEATTRLSIRCGKATNARDMWALASGAAAAHAAHKLLVRLAEVDPDGVEAFAERLAEEGEMPELADDPCETAAAMGFNSQAWIDAERQPAASADQGDAAADCSQCGAPIDWIECPTGSWWSHRAHPADGHDAHPASCPRCKGTGIDPEHSTPDIITPGEEQPGSIEPCVACQRPIETGASA